ncbi:conserved hypothetical protein [Candidatus Terasakiella magnetica]|nr:conserved hypothetical protein [Candidatus Terasakiella magnetica]
MNIRNLPIMAEMSQVGGLGRVTVDVNDLITETLFKRLDHTLQ